MLEVREAFLVEYFQKLIFLNPIEWRIIFAQIWELTFFEEFPLVVNYVDPTSFILHFVAVYSIIKHHSQQNRMQYSFVNLCCL